MSYKLKIDIHTKSVDDIGYRGLIGYGTIQSSWFVFTTIATMRKVSNEVMRNKYLDTRIVKAIMSAQNQTTGALLWKNEYDFDAHKWTRTL